MNRIILSLIFLTLTFFPGAVLADEPLTIQFPTIDLTGTFLAKFQQKGDQEIVAVRIPKWKVEKRTRTYQVTIEIVEIQTREEKGPDGKMVAVESEVKVPKTEVHTEEYDEFVPQSPLKSEVTLSEIKAWNLKGKLLTSEELKTALAKPTYLHVLTEEPKAGQPPVDPFFAPLFRSDLLLVYSPKILELVEQGFEYPASLSP